jgi:predicted nuclease of predicted toxin-antitoxin system
MKFLANENISGTVIQELRILGHDVLAVKESMRSAPDDEVLDRAEAENRILLTHDKDFGELAYRRMLPPGGGIILLRLQRKNPESDNRRIVEVLTSRMEWTGKFSVVTDYHIRCRRLPLGKVVKNG